MAIFKKQSKIETIGGKKSRQQELLESILVWGSLSLLLFLLAVVLFDDYVYYKVNYRERLTPEESLARSSVSLEEIDALIKKLDERQKQFEEILKTQ